MLDDPYKTLGLGREASADEIRKAYRALAKKHHPDLNPGNKAAEETFKSVAAAHELLADPDKRARFDAGEIDSAGHETPRQSRYEDFAAGQAGRRYSGGAAWGAGAGDESMEDLFARMFGARQAGQRAGHDERYALPTGFLDAVNGASRRLTLPDGRTLDVKIPPATWSGDILRLRGQGSAGGDALIEITVNPHPFFTRDGQDIRVTVPVSLPEAVLGGPVEIPAPAGRLRLRIPAGADTGTELRLRGKGVPAHGGQEAGDLYVTLRVQVGQPDAALETFLKGWTPARSDPRAGLHLDAEAP